MDKKIIAIIFMVALLSGCATANPHYQRAQTSGGAATGAGVGWGLATLANGNPSLQYAAAILGGFIVKEITEGAQWKPPASRPVSTTMGEVVVVRTAPVYSSLCGYGMYENPWSGGCISQEFVDRNPEYLCCRRLGRPSSTVTFTTRKEKVAEAKDSGKRLTVDNYLLSELIPPSCQTMNPGADAQCLRRQIPELREKQKLCEAGSSSCPTGFNPGRLAREYTLLAQDLIARQNE